MTFNQLFKAASRTRRRMEFMSALDSWGGWFFAVWFAYGLLDIILQFGATTRMIASGALLVLAIGNLFTRIRKAHKLPETRIAEEIDRELGDKRQPVLCALNLSTDKALLENTGTTQWLKEQSLAGSASRLGSFSWKKSSVRKSHYRKSILLSPTIAPILLCYLALPALFNTVFIERLLLPWRDIPAWTPMTFAIAPDPARVVYGDDLVVTVELGNEPATGDVRMLVRNPGLPVQVLSTYREGQSGYSRRLEKVTANCEVAFETSTRWGNARSAWHSISVAMHPKVISGEVVSKPPGYLKVPAVRMPLSGQEIPVHEGGVVEFRLVSNRALSKAEATCIPAREELPQSRIEARIEAPSTAVFQVPVRHSGSVRFQLTDYEGISMERPLESKVRITVDQRPSIRLISPQTVNLAPVSALIPLQIEAVDDHELIRVDLYRQINKSKERAQNFLEKRGEKSCLVMDQYPLSSLGACPGDTITLYLEARDSNPYALNIATSDPVKIIVLSDEECRLIMQMQTSVREFINQYESLAESYEQAIAALDKAISNNDEALAKELMQQIEQTSRKLNEASQKLAENTPVFDTDDSLKELARQIADKTGQNMDDFNKAKDMPPGSEEQREIFRQMRERLREPGQEMANQRQEARKIAAIAAIYEKLMELKNLVAEQEELVNSLKQYENELSNNRRVTRDQLQALGNEEKEIARKIDNAVGSLTPLLEALPGDEHQTREKIDKLIEDYHSMDIQPMMQAATQHCTAGHHINAQESAKGALEALKKLFNNQGACNANSFCEGLNCSGMSEQAKNALRQLIQGMCRSQQEGQGDGYGSGGGSGFSSGMGQGQPGFRHLNMLGGKRNFLSPVGAGQERQGMKGRQGDAGSGNVGKPDHGSMVRESEQYNTNPASENESETGMGAQDVKGTPPAYRDAVKRYFQDINRE